MATLAVTPAVSGIPTAGTSGGSPPLQSGGQNQKWPIYGQSGYVTPAVSGIPTASERGGEIRSGPLVGKVAMSPLPSRGSPPLQSGGGGIRSGPLVGKVATSPLPSRGSPPLQSGGQNQKWPTCGQSGYVTPAVSGIPTASERGGGIRSGPLVGKVATSPLPSRGSPPLQSGGGKSEVAHLWAKWLCHPCRLGDPHRFRAGGGKSEVAHLWATWLRHPCRLGDPHRFRAGGGNLSEVAHLWAKWLRHPCRLGDPHRFRAGGGESEVAHLWARWLRHPCRLGDPHRFRAGGGNQKWPTYGQSGYVTPAVSGIPTASERGGGIRSRSGPLVGKVAMSPLPSRGSPPLQSGGGAKWLRQKWPTCGQGGYVTPAVSGIPTASERGQNQKWPTYGQSGYVTPAVSGIPTASERGGEIRSGPLVGKVAMSPLPSRGSPPLQSGGGGNQKWPTCGQGGYVTPAVSGIPTASERGAKSEVAHLWAKWLRHPYRLGDPHRFRAGGGESEVAHLWARWLRHPYRLGDRQGGASIRSGPLMGKVATSPLPSRGSPPLQSGGGESEVAHLWARWLRHPCRLGDPHRFRAGGGNQKWPTYGQSGYVTPAVSGIPTASERGAKSERGGDPHRFRAEVAHLWARWLCHPCRLGDPHRFRAGGGESEVAHFSGIPTAGQSGYVTPAVSGIPTASERGGEIRSGPLMGKVATSPLPSRGSPPLQSGGGDQKWPTYGQSGYVTPAVSGIPTASERGGGIRSGPLVGKVATSPLPSRGSPPLQSGGGGIRSGPLVGKVATSPLPSRGSPPLQSGGGNQKWPTYGQSGYPCRLVPTPERGTKSAKVPMSPLPSRGSPPLQSGGQNQKWPTCGQGGYVTPAVSGIPNRFRAGGEIRSGPLMGKVATSPLPSSERRSGPLGDPHRFRAGGKIRSGPLVGKVAMSPLPSRGSPPLQSGGQNQKWPTCGQGGYVSLAVLGIPNAAERGGEIRSGLLVGKVATSPLPSRGSPPLQSGGQNQKWPTCGQSGYVTLAVSGIPTAADRGAKSEVAHLWAKWLRHPCRLGAPHRFTAGGKIRSGPLVGKVATSPLPSRGSPPLHSGGQNQKWPTYGQSGYVTLAVSGLPTAAERGAKSEVAHLWAKWLRHPCRLGDPHRCRAGGKIRNGPLMGKVATSPLPSRGSPPLQSGGQNQKWPTYGQSGYVTPTVSGIPTAAERGGQNQKWPTCGQRGYVTLAVSGIPTAAERGGGGVRSGPLMGKVATSPLPSRGSPPLQSGGVKIRSGPLAGKVATSALAVSGIPIAAERGGKIRSGPLVGKVVTSPLPSRGSPPLQSGGQNQKWPTCGQSGYVTPAVSGIPTASERGAKSEVAHLWAKWLRRPLPSQGSPPLQSGGGGGNQKWPTCGQNGYLTPTISGIPTASERGGKIRSGPLVGKVAMSPLPSRGSPPLRSGGQNRKWPTCGQSGYVTPAISGIPTASERGAKSEVAHLWAKWLRHPCRLGDPHRCRAGGEIRSGPVVGKVVTSPLPCGGSQPLQSGGQNQKWPTYGQSGYVTPAVWGIPTAAERGGKSEVAHLWAKWLRHPCRLGDPHRCRAGGGDIKVSPLWPKWLCHPCRLGDPHRFRAGGKIRSGPLMGKVATSPLPSRGSPPLQSGGQNQKWPTYGQSGYVTRAVSGIPTAAKRGAKSEVAHLWAKWLRHPCRLGDPHRCRAGGGGSEVAHLWAKWLRQPCRLKDPHRFGAGGKIRSGPLVGKVATSALAVSGIPTAAERGGGGNQKWPTCGQSGYVTPAVSGIPTASERGGGGDQKWPTSGQSGYVNPAVSGIPTASERGAKSEVAHLWAKWLRHPCRLRDPHRFGAGGKIRSGPLVGKVATSALAVSGIPTAAERGGGIRSGPLVGKVATSPLPSRGSPPLQSGGGGDQKWPTCGQSGYVTLAVSGIPTASERGAKSEVAHLWARWLRHPCRLGDPQRFRAGGGITSGRLVGKVATSPLPSRGSPPLQSEGQNQKWPTCGQSGYVTLAVSGIPTATDRGGKSELAHLWAKWLCHPCRLGDPHRFRAGGKIRSGPLMGKVATSPLPSRGPHRFRAGDKIRSGPLVGKVAMSPLPSRGSPPLQSGGQNQKWPTCGQGGYVTLAVSGIPTAAERGGKSELADLWARWLRHPCRLGDPHRFRAGGKIRSGVLVGKVATSPLPSQGSPPPRSGGQNQKWPTCGQSGYVSPCRLRDPHRCRAGGGNQKWPTCGQGGYVTPTVSGIPTASERGGGGIKSGPLVGKVAMSPLPSRGSPPLPSGGQNQKWPTCGQGGYVTPAVSGIPNASERGGESQVTGLWAKWLRHPCRLGDPHRFRARGKIRSGPLVGKVAMSPLLSRGSPPQQIGGGNQN